MIAFPEMLVHAAELAGLSVPDDPDEWDSDENERKHRKFAVFCTVQLGAPCPYPGVHFDNARVVAALTEKDISTLTLEGLIEKGFRMGYSK